MKIKYIWNNFNLAEFVLSLVNIDSSRKSSFPIQNLIDFRENLYKEKKII